MGISCAGWIDRDYNTIGKVEDLIVNEPSREVCKDAVIIISVANEVIAKEIQKKCIEWETKKIFLFDDYAIDSTENQYFDLDILKLHDKETFVDAGAFDLQTSIQFYKMCTERNIKCSIYAFEPDRISYEKY